MKSLIAAPIGLHNSMCSFKTHLTTTVSPSFTWSIHWRTSSSWPEIEWNSNSRFRAATSPNSRPPVSISSCFDPPTPVIRTRHRVSPCDARLRRRPGHCRLWPASKSITWTQAFSSKDHRRISFHRTKEEKVIQGKLEIAEKKTKAKHTFFSPRPIAGEPPVIGENITRLTKSADLGELIPRSFSAGGLFLPGHSSRGRGWVVLFGAVARCSGTIGGLLRREIGDNNLQNLHVLALYLSARWESDFSTVLLQFYLWEKQGKRISTRAAYNDSANLPHHQPPGHRLRSTNKGNPKKAGSDRLPSKDRLRPCFLNQTPTEFYPTLYCLSQSEFSERPARRAFADSMFFSNSSSSIERAFASILVMKDSSEIFVKK
ncbi:ankyrin repeat family protein [Striga asiatica]|uniref:Ankyrin repeat family protein n=1 Tax=Striga asiatica TaxID=4170 RepID=A0A5A7Q6S6_STRAF|nr:ankyrin repeat family protein [Striga asiatica]